MSRSFRPWCPRCDRTSPPGSRWCTGCGLYLYPTRLPNGRRPGEPSWDDDDDVEVEEAVA
jgi:hypothetical protein